MACGLIGFGRPLTGIAASASDDVGGIGAVFQRVFEGLQRVKLALALREGAPEFGKRDVDLVAVILPRGLASPLGSDPPGSALGLDLLEEIIPLIALALPLGEGGNRSSYS